MGDPLEQEAVELLQRLIRFDTVNPPGAERPAQELLAGLLRDAGFEVTLVGRTDERPNLVARLRRDANAGGPAAAGTGTSADGFAVAGTGTSADGFAVAGTGAPTGGPTLCLLSHVDTVLADPADWSRDPWSGDLHEGFVWGRGALDMKSQTAAEVAAALSLAREGWRPARGELLVVVVVDEETGGGEGAKWLCEHHPDLVRCDLLLNEGAGTVIPYDGGRVYGVCVAEKGVFRFRLTTDGIAGHASIPKIGDNALLRMAPLLQRMADAQPGFDLTEGPRAMLHGLGLPVDGDPTQALTALRERDPVLAMLVEPMLGVTLAPTRITASQKINVIPSRAEVEVDCRVPPGMEADRVRERIAEVLGDEGYRLEFSEQVVGNASPVESVLMDAIRDWVGEQDPGATIVPTILPGFTDSRTFRAAFPDCVAYGFMPHRHMTLYEAAPLIHGADERIDARDVGFAAGFFHDVTRRLLT